jgi:hypothetical protein
MPVTNLVIDEGTNFSLKGKKSFLGGSCMEEIKGSNFPAKKDMNEESNQF